MVAVRQLARVLATADQFDHPRIDLEQYPTPPEIAARLTHLMDLRGDLSGRVVIDLGCGPGILAIAAAHGGPSQVIGLEIDPKAISIAERNEQRIRPPQRIDWVLGDAMQPPLCGQHSATVVMNPPFGAQRKTTHADRAFLDAARNIARVSYSIHNAGSGPFIQAFAADFDGTITDEFALTFDLARQYSFHRKDETQIDAECYRIEWANASSPR